MDLCINDADGDGVCDEEEVNICTVEFACNFGEEGECDFISCYAIGCTNPIACNFDSEAEILDASCVFATGCDYCSGEQDGTGTVVDGDADDNGICDGLENLGCTDVDACNFDAGASEDDGSCEYPEETYLNCDGSCINDADGDGVCDEEEVNICTVEFAL